MHQSLNLFSLSKRALWEFKRCESSSANFMGSNVAQRLHNIVRAYFIFSEGDKIPKVFKTVLRTNLRPKSTSY